MVGLRRPPTAPARRGWACSAPAAPASALGAMHGYRLQAAAGQRHRHRHRHDVVRHRPRLLLRQALHPADRAAPAVDPARRLDRRTPALAQALDVNPLFLVGIALAVVMAWAFRNTKWGLIVRMTGDSAPAARAMGVSVDLVRFLATAAGGFLAGIGGAFLSLYYPGSWNEGLSSGQGLMAVALVIFARWDPIRCFLARAAVRRRRRARPGAAVGRHHPGLLLLQRRALHPDAAHHDRLGRLQVRGARRARRTLDHQMRL